jgi:TFIIF-interacting CTD phosphatase-like protein
MPSENRVLLPRKLLCLDLDETLIHAEETPFEHYQLVVDGDYMAVRPGLLGFLDRMSKHYDFMIWSVSGEKYVTAMLNVMWPKEHELKAIYTGKKARVHVENGQGTPTYKELWKVTRRLPYHRSQVLALDDKPIAHKYNYGNLVQIKAFLGDPEDREFEKVGNLLENLAGVPDVRSIEKRWFKMNPEMYADRRDQGCGSSAPGI